jgi:hypothetical protein
VRAPKASYSPVRPCSCANAFNACWPAASSFRSCEIRAAMACVRRRRGLGGDRLAVLSLRRWDFPLDPDLPLASEGLGKSWRGLT